MKRELNPAKCKHWVFSGERWDFAGHQCAAKPVKDGLCTRHQPDVEAKRKAAVVKTQRDKWNFRMRQTTAGTHGYDLAAALRQALTALSYNGDVTQYRALAKQAREQGEKALKSFDDAMKRYDG